MTMKLDAWRAAYRQAPRADEMDAVVARRAGLLKDEEALENEHSSLIVKLEKNTAKLKKVEEHKGRMHTRSHQCRPN